MALKPYTDIKGDNNHVDDKGIVYTQGGTYNTGLNTQQWDQRQQDEIKKKNNLQLSEINNNIATVDKNIASRDKAYATSTSITNDNPFYAEATRVGKIAKTDEKYQMDRQGLIAEKANHLQRLDSVTKAQADAENRALQTKEAGKPQLFNSKDANGNTIITAVDPYTGKVISTNNAGGGKSTTNTANSALEKARLGNTANMSVIPGSSADKTQTPGAPMSVTPQTAQPEPQQSFLGSLYHGIVDPAVKYGSAVFEAGNQIDRTIQNALPGSENSILHQKVLNGTATPDEQKRYIDMNSPRFMSDKNAQAFSNNPALETVKIAASGASYAIPFGSGLVGAITGGALAGGLSAFSDSDASVKDVALGAGGGAIGGAVFHGASKALGGVTKGLSKITDSAADSAAARVSKASPSAFNKASQAGLNLNELIQKHFPAGSTYEEMIGTVAQRGKGGVINKEIQSSEKIIQKALQTAGNKRVATATELVRPIESAIQELQSVPGYEAQITALQEFAKSTKAMFRKGLSATQLTTLKRALDSEFGKSVVDEGTGSVVAQAQKMIANNARGILKDALPAVKRELENESELYTIRPILETARAIENTQGSGIRKGLSSFDVTKPGTYLDPILSDTRVSSFITKLKGLKVPESSSNGAEIGARLGSAVAGNSGNQQNSQINGEQADSSSNSPINQQVQSTQSIQPTIIDPRN